MQLLQSGKRIIIAITVVFSCLSFTLGFSVGRFGADGRPAVSTVPAEQPVPTPAGQTQQLQTPLPPEQAKEQPEIPATPPTSAQPLTTVTESPLRPSSAPRETPGAVTMPQSDVQAGPKAGNQPGNVPARAEREPVARQVKEASKTTVTENIRASVPQKKESPAPTYSVQLGAFRNKAEAEKFKAKYSKKGYKIYIEAVKAEKNVKIYKLRTGEFSEKKDTEVLAVKLKKNDNLKTFVVTIGK